jgi:mannose-6-phosphate isomerase class I
MAVHLRGELLKEKAIDYYLASDKPNDTQLVPQSALYDIFASLVNYPMRCKPVYLEGVWGGTYVKKLRKLPDTMRNCAWVFDLIPMEVSIVVEAGNTNIEFPFFTFVQTEGTNLMGQDCVHKFKGYFPIRFNYDDSYHSNGNMSIQVHSGHDYNIDNFGELGRQDESYYIVATGHNAKTFVGFKDEIDPQEFIEKAKVSEKEFTSIDYEKYIHAEESKPGMQVMIPAGTIHSSGRNQVVLEIGSLTIGSYTYKLYDYLRADLDGIPRPIHTWHGERVLCQERNKQWVRKNIVHSPQLVRGGKEWAEYIVGEHDLLYFSLRRLEFSDAIKDNTNGVFHVLSLVDGEKVKIHSVNHPEYSYIQNFMDIVIVPANMGEYIIHNLGNQPVCIHKTLLKEGFIND